MKKINNKILILALGVLITIFVLSKVFRSPKLQSNLRKELVVLDTSAVTAIEIKPSNETEKPFKLKREGKKWTLLRDNKNYPADTASVKSILEALSNMQAERMVSRKKEKWEAFEVTDKSTKVTVFAGGKEKADFHLGKTGFNQSRGGGFGGAYTYVRLDGENETYSVNGFLESTFNRSLNDLRDKSFLRIPKDKINKIVFNYPADSSFILEKKDTIWFANNQPVDKEKVNTYLDHLNFKNIDNFSDESKPSGKADATIQVTGAGGQLGTIEAWKNDSSWIFRSSLQKDVFFSGSGSTVNQELLVGVKDFTSTKN